MYELKYRQRAQRLVSAGEEPLLTTEAIRPAYSAPVQVLSRRFIAASQCSIYVPAVFARRIIAANRRNELSSKTTAGARYLLLTPFGLLIR